MDQASERGGALRADDHQPGTAVHPAVLALAQLLGRSAARACPARDLNHKEEETDVDDA
jgi:hypothetical protein